MIITENSNDIYIGSTTKTLKQRLQEHESRYRCNVYYSSHEILKQGNYKILLIKNFACNNVEELETEETKYQRDLVCVNKCRARITYEEKKERRKQNYIDNREKIKQYYIDNRERRKQYNIDNRENLNKKKREYRARKKKELLENKKKRIIFKIKKQ